MFYFFSFFALCTLAFYLTATYQSVTIDSQVINSGGSNSQVLFTAGSAQAINEVNIEVFYPVNTMSLATHCTLGVALVKAIGMTPTIQLINGQPLVIPQNSLIAGQVWEFTTLDDDVQTETPFIYNSVLDPNWYPLHLNFGNELVLLTILDCSSPAQVIYSGLFAWK